MEYTHALLMFIFGLIAGALVFFLWNRWKNMAAPIAQPPSTIAS